MKTGVLSTQSINEGLGIGLSLKLFLIMAITGIAVALFYDFFRSFRHARKKAYKEINIIVHIEDVIFVIVSFVLVIFVVIIFNDGEIRGYMVLGLIAGLLFYYALISPLSNRIIFWVIYITLKAFQIPFKYGKKIVKFFINKINKKILKNTRPIEENNI